ncbi:glycosyltransferase family 2 protein [Paucibacter sp. R3-3]|uniref:Glycosyltransferase family 2 protein n=1 Tax=Roseateles agri TaxID=3098619 RepID=A0ABU5DRF9_9BURK|nr:glycosyltransferase family 2 protein [Paucibacter sp. R3-3]MDY0748911.1 glycosyltransferase family 2 protein [Paucibacter sp. R3-3]
MNIEQRVLLVIPTLNEARGIEGVIARLLDDAPPELRIVVADGGSSDGTPELVQKLAQQEPRLSLLHNPRRIQSAAVNLAVQRFGSEAEVLVRCDAHAGYPAGFVRSLLATLERSGADAVVVPMDSQGETCFQRAVAWVSNTALGTGGSAHRGGRRSGFVDHGHHAAFRMASFRRAGGYDESFTHNEDAELDCRQRGLGSRIWLDADIRLDYAPRATPAGLARQYFAYGRGRSRTVRRHPGSMRARQLALPVNLVLLVLCTALSPWLPLLAAWPLAYLAVLALGSLQIALRQRSACGLLAGAAAATMHLAWAAGFLSGLTLIRETRWLPVQSFNQP